MKIPLRFFLLPVLLPLVSGAAEKITVTVTNELDAARPAETITVPWSEIASRLPKTLPSHLLVKDASGATIPDQLINLSPEEHHDNYESIIFQHDFAAGEKTATFTIEKTDAPVPLFPSKVFARFVPERFDDFAWENDRIAHRAYGPALETPTGGKDQMVSSGLDVWSKRVRYSIIDRWYLMGHYHEDTGEGLDMYDTGKTRGCGGTGVWDGKVLHVSHNWKTWKVLANGPVRAIFELTYEPWDAGAGLVRSPEKKISETKRFTVDAGHNLDEVESSFKLAGGSSAQATIGIGIGKHTKRLDTAELTKNEKENWLSLWEKYTKDGMIGTAVLLAPAPEKVSFLQSSENAASFAEDNDNYLILTTVQSGNPLRYYTGAGWDRSGDFPDKATWEKYLSDFAARLKSPLKVSVGDAQ